MVSVSFFCIGIAPLSFARSCRIRPLASRKIRLSRWSLSTKVGAPSFTRPSLAQRLPVHRRLEVPPRQVGISLGHGDGRMPQELRDGVEVHSRPKLPREE